MKVREGGGRRNSRILSWHAYIIPQNELWTLSIYGRLSR